MTAVRTLLRTTAFLILALACLPTAALAHPGHAGASFGGGMLHPFSGVDHLLAMIAVGLLASRTVGSGRWSVPASFVGFMLLGGLIGLAGFGPDVAAVEWAIAASVLVFGAMVCALPRVLSAGAAVVVAAFAVFHGYAHIAEMGDASPAGFLAGMFLGTALLHAFGLMGGLALQRSGGARYVRIAGASVGFAFLLAIGVA